MKSPSKLRIDLQSRHTPTHTHSYKERNGGIDSGRQTNRDTKRERNSASNLTTTKTMIPHHNWGLALVKYINGFLNKSHIGKKEGQWRCNGERSTTIINQKEIIWQNSLYILKRDWRLFHVMKEHWNILALNLFYEILWNEIILPLENKESQN